MDHILPLSVFGAPISVETTSAEVHAGLEAEWTDFVTGYDPQGPLIRVRVTCYRHELDYCHARHDLITQRGAGVWPCRKCVGDILFDASLDKHFLAYTPNVDAVVSEVGWIIGRIVYRHLGPNTVALHASAVVDDTGAGVLFLGPSGAGKSTLAALMVAHGWRLVANETTYVDVGDGDGADDVAGGDGDVAPPVGPRLRGLPSPVELEPPSVDLVQALTGLDPRSRSFRARAHGETFSEAEARLRLIVLPSLSPDRPFRLAPSSDEQAHTQLTLRHIPGSIYRQPVAPPAGWSAALLSRVPAWTLDGVLEDRQPLDWITQAAHGEFVR